MVSWTHTYCSQLWSGLYDLRRWRLRLKIPLSPIYSLPFRIPANTCILLGHTTAKELGNFNLVTFSILSNAPFLPKLVAF